MSESKGLDNVEITRHSTLSVKTSTQSKYMTDNERSLFNLPKFFGETFKEEDRKRLTSGLHKVKNCLSDGIFRSLDEISSITGVPPATVSARYRTLKAMKVPVEKVNCGGGLWKYRIVPE